MALETAELLVAEAQSSPAGSEGAFFLPYLTGERCPHPDPFARGGWIGVTARTTRGMLIRSLLEGVTFGMRDALEIMKEMGIPIKEVRASGGGARSPRRRGVVRGGGGDPARPAARSATGGGADRGVRQVPRERMHGLPR